MSIVSRAFVRDPLFRACGEAAWPNAGTRIHGCIASNRSAAGSMERHPDNAIRFDIRTWARYYISTFEETRR